MRLLPSLATTAAARRLPLSDATADRIVEALLTVDRPRRIAALAMALAADPPFAAWTLCKAFSQGKGDLQTLELLADWLADAPASCLLPAADEPVSLPADQEETWADRVSMALAAARRSAELAGQAQLDADQAYLLGLVHAAPQWMESSTGLLPDWLCSAAAAIDTSAADAPAIAAECVALARRGLAGSSDDAQVRAAWLGKSGGGDRLASLLATLARLEVLEGDFHHTLTVAKLDAMKELAYGASHEINNPLANISARAQTLLEDERDPERRRKLAAINSQAFRAHEMIADMMLFARPPAARREAVDLTVVVSTLAAELAPRAAGQQTQLVYHAPAEPLVVQADRTQMAVAVRSLAVNALEALVEGGRVELSLQRTQLSQSEQLRPSREAVQITVADNGPGIAPDACQHLFDPFYSGREAGRGLGLGLSKCWRIVTGHGGRIEVESAKDQGARFTITLPRE